MRQIDLNCGHESRFRHQAYDTEYCVWCAKDRGTKHYDEALGVIRQYHSLRSYMDMDSESGSRVVLWFLNNGHDHDKRQLEALGMKLGDVFTVDHTEVGSCHTDVYLKEFPGKRFNHVNFGEATIADEIGKPQPK